MVYIHHNHIYFLKQHGRPVCECVCNRYFVLTDKEQAAGDAEDYSAEEAKEHVIDSHTSPRDWTDFYLTCNY